MSALRAALTGVTETAARLSRLSRRTYQNPYTQVEWPSVVQPERDWFSTPEYVSLYGTPVWADLDEPT